MYYSSSRETCLVRVGAGVHLSLGANAKCDPAILRRVVTQRRPVPEKHLIAPNNWNTPRARKGHSAVSDKPGLPPYHGIAVIEIHPGHFELCSRDMVRSLLKGWIVDRYAQIIVAHDNDSVVGAVCPVRELLCADKRNAGVPIGQVLEQLLYGT